MEWIGRYGRATVHTQQADALLLPVGDNWFSSNLSKEEGVFSHCCEPQKFFQYYDNYCANYHLFMEQPRKAFRSTPYLTIARDMLWSMYNCIGKNYHYAKIRPDGVDQIDSVQEATTVFPKYMTDWKGDFYTPTPGLVQQETVAKHRCSRCPSEIPKRARAIHVIKNIV
jgi:hypothetical protein